QLPVADSEQVSAQDRLVERNMLELRIADGLDVDKVPEAQQPSLAVHRDRGHLDAKALADGRAVLTRSGRLLADAVIRALVPGAGTRTAPVTAAVPGAVVVCAGRSSLGQAQVGREGPPGALIRLDGTGEGEDAVDHGRDVGDGRQQETDAEGH